MSHLVCKVVIGQNDETVQQQLSLKEGGDPNNINDYLVDENGFF